MVCGKANACEEYFEEFAKCIAAVVQKKLDDAKWRSRVTKEFEINGAFEKLMSVQLKIEQLISEESAFREQVRMVSGRRLAARSMAEWTSKGSMERFLQQ